MNRFRIFALLSAALSVVACGAADPNISTTARFEANPLSMYQNPTIKQQVNHAFISNEDDLLSAAARIEADAQNIAILEAEAAAEEEE